MIIMQTKLNTFLNCLIGAFMGVFIARCIYTYWDYKTHPAVYAVSSAPWYTAILLSGGVSGTIISAALIIKAIIRKKLKRMNFKLQISFAMTLIIAGFVSSLWFDQYIWYNLGWVFTGIIFFINPVYPKNVIHLEQEKAEKGIRIGAMIVVFMGLMNHGFGI